MHDLVQLTVKAGHGGRGKISFRREKYVPKGGPDGGDGGDGGDVVLVATRHLATLSHLAGKPVIEAKSGEAGGTRKKHGANARPATIKVPLGTRVILAAQNQAAKNRELKTDGAPLSRRDTHFTTYQTDYRGDELLSNQERADTPVEEIGRPDIQKPPIVGRVLVDLTKEGEQYLLCQGGFGGRGNTHFKSSTRTTPRIAENGTPGEIRTIWLELRVLADIGLVGLPSVGKSTLLSVLTKARPKIAAYPFTTLEPQLGRMNLGEREVVLADIPGLIEGASQGKGLGTDFLRHIAHCQTLWFVLAVPDEILLDESVKPKAVAQLLWDQYQSVKQEIIETYRESANKPSLVALNKVDVLSEEVQQAAKSYFDKKNTPLICISGATGFGLSDLLNVSQQWLMEPQELESARE